MYNGLNKLVLKNVMLIQYYFLEKQQQTDMTFSFKVISIITLILFCLKKDNNRKWDTHFESEKELYQFRNINMYIP